MADRNLILQLLITAKDNAGAVFSLSLIHI